MATVRLTNYMRQAFVSAVMNDVPQIDYRTQIQKYVEKEAAALVPEELRPMVVKYPAWFSTRRYFFDAWGSVYAIIPEEKVTFPESVKNEVRRLSRLHDAQAEARRELERKLNSVALGCTTKKRLEDSLPEFKKYLPADEVAACRSVPALANVVSDFVKAGWPKAEKAELKAAK